MLISVEQFTYLKSGSCLWNEGIDVNLVWSTLKCLVRDNCTWELTYCTASHAHCQCCNISCCRTWKEQVCQALSCNENYLTKAELLRLQVWLGTHLPILLVLICSPRVCWDAHYTHVDLLLSLHFQHTGFVGLRSVENKYSSTTCCKSRA